MGQYAAWVVEARAKPPRQTLVDALKAALPTHLRRVLARGRQVVVSPPAPWDGRMPFLTEAVRRARARKGRIGWPRPSPRIVHLIGTLGPGGAERQLCNFVIAAKRLGHDVRVILMWQPEGDHGHYCQVLDDAGVDVTVAGAGFRPEFTAAIRKVPGGLSAVSQIPQECWPVVVDVLGELLTDPPDVLHAWLDGSNVWGGMASLFAQVPLVVLSTRNVNPSNFSYLDLPFFRQAYRELLESPTIRLINNSHAGAEDYAAWLGIGKDRIAVVLNGLEFAHLPRPSQDQVDAFRSRAGIPPRAPIVAGVFRLAEEKQPFTFLEVVARVSRDCPDLYAVVAGIGPMEPQMREYVASNGLDTRVRFLGRLTDVAPLYGAATTTLLCSRKEGTPNVLLESQWLRCPVVSTRAGGAIDAVDDGVTGYLRDVGDVAGLQQAVTTLLRDGNLRARMAASGPPFIERRFSVERMVAETLNLYGITHEHELGV